MSASYRAPRPKPRCQDAAQWLRGRLGQRALAPLTTQDRRALDAYLHALELYVTADASGQRAALLAIGGALAAMQPQCWDIAKAAIPWAREWEDEAALWPIFERAARDTLNATKFFAIVETPEPAS